MRFPRAVFLYAYVGLTIAGCSREANVPSQSPDLSSSDKTLNVYNWNAFIEPLVILSFEKEFGIKVHYDVYDSNEIMEAKLLAGHTHYDIVVPGGSFLRRKSRQRYTGNSIRRCCQI